MSGEHQFNLQARQHAAHLFGRDPGPQRTYNLAYRIVDGPGMVDQLFITKQVDPVVFFGQVDQIEVQAERRCKWACCLVGKGADLVSQTTGGLDLFPAAWGSAPPCFGVATHPLLQLEDSRGFLPGNYLAEDIA